MRLVFRKSKLRKTCSSMREMEKAYGKNIARKLAQRLAELGAADTLADMSHLPPARCHALTGDRLGQFSVDLAHPYRLLFEPDHDPVPTDAQGGVIREHVTAICIVEVADTH